VTDIQLQWGFTVAALFVLLGITALNNDAITISASLALLAAGFLAFPRQRSRGALAATAALCVAAIIASIAR